jgi:hypothetical protein
MKKITILFFTFITLSLNAQTNNKISFADDLKGHTANSLIPFQKDDKWGYLDKKTMKVVIKPTFRRASLFLKDRAFIETNDGFFFLNIKGKLEVKKIGDNEIPTIPSPKIVNRDNWKGFTLEKNGTLASYSDFYTYADPYTFIKNNIRYTKVVSDNGTGIVDSTGKIFEPFAFGKYENIQYRSSSEKNHFLILFSDNANHFWAINQNNKKFDLGVFDDLFFTSELLPAYESADATLQYIKAVRKGKVFFIDLFGKEYLP